MKDATAITVDVVDLDELVDTKGRGIKHPMNTYTGQVLEFLKAAGSNFIGLYGQSNGVATMVDEIVRRIGLSGRLVRTQDLRARRARFAKCIRWQGRHGCTRYLIGPVDL